MTTTGTPATSSHGHAELHEAGPGGALTERRRLQELLRGFDVGLLITLGGDELHARPMMVADITADGRVVFATRRHSRAALEVEADARVAIALQQGERYAFVVGTADVHRDRARIDQLWQEAWRAWFPAGPDDEDLHVLEVYPADLELWEGMGSVGARHELKR